MAHKHLDIIFKMGLLYRIFLKNVAFWVKAPNFENHFLKTNFKLGLNYSTLPKGCFIMLGGGRTSETAVGRIYGDSGPDETKLLISDYNATLHRETP